MSECSLKPVWEVKLKVRYVGLDIGKWKCRAAIMDQEGLILDEFTFTNNQEGIENLTAKLTYQDRVVMESTGSVWSNLYDRLDDRRIHVSLVNPLKTKAIASAKIKSDNHNEPFGYLTLVTFTSQEAGIQPFGDQTPSSKNSLLRSAFPIQSSGMSRYLYRSSREQALRRLDSS